LSWNIDTKTSFYTLGWGEGGNVSRSSLNYIFKEAIRVRETLCMDKKIMVV